MIQRFVEILCLSALIAVSACTSFDRANNSAAARRKMVGMSKEQVLICMGPPKQKATVGATEVWSYASSSGETDTPGFTQKLSSSLSFKNSIHEKESCTVNVVMTNDVVSVVHYNGPRGGLLNPDEQCGYAIEHCVE